MYRIANAIIGYLYRNSRTRIVLAYLGFATVCCGGIAISSITITSDKINIKFGTIDWSIVVILIITLIPVIVVLINPNLHIAPKSNTFIPLFQKFFDLLDIDNYSQWTYYVANAGDLRLSKKQYDNFITLTQTINCRVRGHSPEKLEKLIDNLSELVSDLLRVLDEHLTLFGNSNYYTIDKFYKIQGNNYGYNPNYDNDVKSYIDYCFLLSDLILELTRLLNLLLNEIRKVQPEFLIDKGNLFIRDTFDSQIIQYQPNEISDTPYPGISQFMIDRKSRKEHFAK